MATTKPNSGRVFSYMRWSTDRQTWGDSERRQAQQALDWCQRNNRVLDERSFTDRGVSGWKGAHRQSGKLAALLKLVTTGDTILVEDSSRWSREQPLDSLNALRDVVNKGVEIVFLKTGVIVNRGNFNDPAVFLPNVLGSFIANQENELRASKIRSAMVGKRQKLAEGKLIFGRLPAWLQWQGKPKTEGRQIVKNDDKVKQVLRVFELCLQGKGALAIEKAMTGEPPLSNHRKANWNVSFIIRLLRDRSVMGFHPGSEKKVYPQIVSPELFNNA
jgi:DNA invertase Pin-like site-specific DNA recombinase